MVELPLSCFSSLLLDIFTNTLNVDTMAASVKQLAVVRVACPWPDQAPRPDRGIAASGHRRLYLPDAFPPPTPAAALDDDPPGFAASDDPPMPPLLESSVADACCRGTARSSSLSRCPSPAERGCHCGRQCRRAQEDDRHECRQRSSSRAAGVAPGVGRRAVAG